MDPDVPPAPSGDPDMERRLEEVVEVIQQLAALNFEARATVGTAGDFVDAVAAGVNSLGEELQASYDELEHRVADRTAELARASEELSRRALHDDLTGLANRTAFWERLSHRMSVMDQRRTGFAILFLDLDDFKEVNDSLGHAAGDQLLVETARRITDELRSGDVAARVGGDEFVVLLDEVGEGEHALAVARRVGERVRAPQEIEGRRHVTTTSIGVAVGRPGGLSTPDAIVAAADAAMYEAKRAGRGLSVLYQPERHGQAPVIDVGWGA